MSPVLWFFVTFLALAAATQTPFIIGGEPASPGSIPYQALLNFKTSGSDRNCSGSLLSANSILTSASCVTGVGIGVAILGEVDLTYLASSATVDVVVVADILIHPDFDSSTFEANLAIVKLDRRVRLRTGSIETVEFDSSHDVTHEGHMAQVSGWNQGSYLRFASVNILTKLSCTIRYPEMPDSTMCAGNLQQAPCKGDEGAPLAMDMMGKNSVIGIYSHVKDGDCTVGWPAVYTRVSTYALWIWLNM